MIREDELMLELKSNLNEKKAYLSLEGKKDYKRSKNICDCGGKFNNSDKAHHFKTNKHKEYEKQTINNITNNYNITNLTNLTINNK